MEEKLMELIGKYGLEALMMGLSINVLTGILKLPLKAWAKKLTDGSKATRYIVFLPIVIGFALTAAYIKLRTGHMALDKAFTGGAAFGTAAPQARRHRGGSGAAHSRGQRRAVMA